MNSLDCVRLTDYFSLIDALISDIQHLESEVVCTRYELSRYLPEKERYLLRSDILSNLVDVSPAVLLTIHSFGSGAVAETLWIRMSG